MLIYDEPLLSGQPPFSGHLGGGGTPHMKGVGMLVGNFELNPQKRPIWA